jgi:F-type H+-transporting ATPase subunit delta
VRPALEGYAAAILQAAGADERAQLAQDLRAFEQLVSVNAELQGALTDTGVSAQARRAIVSELLEARVSPLARRAAAYAAGAVSAPEVPSALGWLAQRAELAVEGVEGDELRMSHSAARERVGGFATALFEDLATDRLEEVEDELFRFARTVDTTPALRTALTDAGLANEARLGVVDALLSGKVQGATLRLVDYVVRGGRPRDFVGTLDWLVETTATARGWRIARVRSAAELDDDQRSALSDSLANVAGAPVELQVTIDPDLLGGALVRVGDLQIDATARGRLNRLRDHLLPVGWEERDFHNDRARNPKGAH